MEQRITSGGIEYKVLREGGNAVSVSRADGATLRTPVEALPDGTFLLEGPTGRLLAHAVRDANTVWVRVAGRTYRFEPVRASRGRSAHAEGDLASPMPGQVQKLLVIEGDAVKAGQTLLVVEAMKMQLEIKAPHAGTVKRVLAREAQQVEAGVPLVELEAATATTPPGKQLS